jgi:hypothetical protein
MFWNKIYNVIFPTNIENTINYTIDMMEKGLLDNHYKANKKNNPVKNNITPLYDIIILS